MIFDSMLTTVENKPRMAVVSPFIDKQHGTERCVAEQVERLAKHYEVHVYSNRVEDVDLRSITWHRIPALPGPHLIAYCWWFIANHLWRWWDRRVRGREYDLLYSPGINCADADVISVHIVFSEFCRQMQDELKFRSNPVKAWPRLMHRRLYYGLIKMLERRIYTREDQPLVIVSRKVAADLDRSYGQMQHLTPVYHGWDAGRFGPGARARLRSEARQALKLGENDFALLLIGNDWKNKGFGCLIRAVGRLQNPVLRVLAVGSDLAASYPKSAADEMQDRVRFLPPRRDIEFYYAAADAYVGPSLKDAFGMPPLEAMACGLPVIVSSQAGVSELITNGVDGLVLEDPRDSEDLASKIADIYGDTALRQRLSENAVKTAGQYTWDNNAEQLRAVMEEILRARRGVEHCPTPASC